MSEKFNKKMIKSYESDPKTCSKSRLYMINHDIILHDHKYDELVLVKENESIADYDYHSENKDFGLNEVIGVDVYKNLKNMD